MPILPEFKEQNIEEFAEGLEARADTVNVSCTVERFDGADPAAGDVQNQLALFVDGFVPDMNLCDARKPLMIGTDQQFVPVPGLGLVSDQSRPAGFGQPQQPEGIDISNFEQPGAPIYLTAEEEAQGLGAVDFIFSSTTSGYALEAASGSEVGFAPLFGGYTGEGLNLSLSGDWLILENPSQYSGPDLLLLPQEVSFGGNDIEYAQLETATDGVFFRYAGEHFEENITSHSDFDTVFGTPPDYSSIPVRIDAGRALLFQSNTASFLEFSFSYEFF